MRPILLTISNEKRIRRNALIAIWMAAAGLALFTTHQARELSDTRATLSRVPEVSGVKRTVVAAITPGEQELALDRMLRAHAATRFANWRDALTNLAQALPQNVTIERLSLNAKTARGDASVRVNRVEEVSLTVETLERTSSFSSASARRCEQTRALDQTGMRCELQFRWTLQP